MSDAYLNAYRELASRIGGCPIEQGFFMGLADHECKQHGRLPFDRSPACGCWPQEATVIPLPVEQRASKRGRRAA